VPEVAQTSHLSSLGGSAHEDDFERAILPLLAETGSDGESVVRAEMDVQEKDVRPLGVQNLKDLGGRARFEHSVAAALEDRPDERSNRRLVVRDENRAGRGGVIGSRQSG
jgi:hypothetical protein